MSNISSTMSLKLRVFVLIVKMRVLMSRKFTATRKINSAWMVKLNIRKRQSDNGNDTGDGSRPRQKGGVGGRGGGK